MRKVAVLNQKGGVGKTTTAVNLSAALAELGHRVCVVDMDPQAHATLHLGVTAREDERSLLDVLLGECALADITHDVRERLALVRASIDLAAAEAELAGVEGREAALSTALDAVESQYDFLFIDCPPSLGVLTINALAAVDEVLIPMQPHFLALHGLSKLLETIELAAERLNPKLRLRGVVLCMYDAGTRLAAEVARDVARFFDQVQGQPSPWADACAYETRIRRNVRLAEAPSFGKSILDYASNSPGAADYRQLARDYLDSLTAAPTVAGTIPRRRDGTTITSLAS